MLSFKTLLRLVFLFTVAFGLGLVFAFIASVNRPASDSSETVPFTVEEGQGPRTIATKLKELGLLEAERPFFVYVLATGRRNSFYPGSYQLKRDMSIRQLVNILGDPEQQDIAVRVLEGWRIKDIASEVAKKTAISEQEFLAATPVEQYEGYLFPDTYRFHKDVTAVQIVTTMRANFDRRTKGLGLTPEDVILASIVEREAQLDEDRPKVAGVYLNRLKINMPLQADPTVQYAKGSWGPITVADYRSVVSPYNTYLNSGLPPTPISNPGLKSLQAVKSPADHDYIFFFHTSDGKTYYSRTNEEHVANKNLYLR